MNSNIIKDSVKKTPLKNPAKKALNKYGELSFYLDHRNLSDKEKIIYPTTPPAGLNNIGDHAQVVGIKKWFKKHFEQCPVVEVDKNESTQYISKLKKLTTQDDLIILHSGGNLNHRSKLSEGARRTIIKEFPDNQIIQLPQTIYFGDSEYAQEQLQISRDIYNSHNSLIITARDPVSLELANEYFDVPTLMAPDFALLIDAEDYIELSSNRSGCLLCLRQDEESDLTKEQQSTIESQMLDLGYETSWFDTTLDERIPKSKREYYLKSTLQKFANNEVIITDRFHGMIFSVITQTPCVAIDTVDHKISSSSHWFDDLEHISTTSKLNQVKSVAIEVRHNEIIDMDFGQAFFDQYSTEIMSVVSELDNGY